MTHVQIDRAGLEAAAAGIPAGEPVFMVNLLRFRERADYGTHADHGPCSGAEAYFTRYLPAFNQVVGRLGGSELVYAGTAIAQIVGPPTESWDGAGVVRYPDIDVFRRLLADPAYLATAEPHRVASLADWRLIATAQLS